MNRKVSILLALSVLTTTHVLANTSSDEDPHPNQASLAAVSNRVVASELSQAISYRLLGVGGGFRIRLGQTDTNSDVNMARDRSERRGWVLASNAPTPIPEESFDWSTITLWGTPVVSGVENRIAPLTSEGTVKILMLGAEHTSEDEQTVMGLVISKDWLDIDTTYNQGTITGSGITYSPYLVHMLDAEWTLDASFGMGRSDTTSKSPGLTSEPELDRRFITVGLTRAQMHGKWFVMYKGAVSSSEDKVKAFVYSDGQLGTASTTRLNQLRLGIYATYNNPPVSPFIAVYQMYNDFSVSSASEVKPREYGSTQQMQIGLNASSGPLYGAVAYQIEKGRTQWRIYGGVRF